MVKDHIGLHIDVVWANLYKGLRLLINVKHWGDKYTCQKFPGIVLLYNQKRAHDGPFFSVMLDGEEHNGTSYVFPWSYTYKHVDQNAPVNKNYKTTGNLLSAQGEGKK